MEKRVIYVLILINHGYLFSVSNEVIREWNLSNIKNTVSVKKSNCKEKINTDKKVIITHLVSVSLGKVTSAEQSCH